MTKLLETFGTGVSFVAERKSFTALLSARPLVALPRKELSRRGSITQGDRHTM